MFHGFIKVAAASPDLRVADTVGNTDKIIKEIEKARALNVKLLAFPELCITSASCGDLFRQRVLLDGALEGLKRIAESTVHSSMLVIVGLPIAHNGSLYNCAAVIQSGNILRLIAKSALANYAEAYELRYFAPAPEVAHSSFSLFDKPVSFGKNGFFTSNNIEGFKIGVVLGDEFYSPTSGTEELALGGATVIVNLAASNETVGKREYRRAAIAVQSKKLNCAYIYCNCSGGESTTDLVYSGHSLIAENGTLLSESKLFEPSMLVTELDIERLNHDRIRNNMFVSHFGGIGYDYHFSQKLEETSLTRTIRRSPFVPENESEREERLALILGMQAEGLRKRVAHINCKKIVVGISGGLDSALALLVMVKAMDTLGRDRKDIIAVTMPCFGTTSRTKSNAEKLCDALGVTFMEVNIKEAVMAHFKDIGQDPNNYDVTYENSQARERTQVLMDIANKNSGIVIGTGDLSELALGWATYNGDHMSMYGVNASIPKTLVRCLVKHYADEAPGAVSEPLYDILATPVSPELIPPKDGEISQVTENLVGPYELHDFFLFYYVRYGFSPEKILRMAKYAFDGEYSEEIISGWLRTFMRRFITQQFKRSCVPDGPKVGSVALSPRGDWRMPSDTCSDIWKL